MKIGITGFALLIPFITANAFAESGAQKPTASEAFHLRNECAALGEKIADDNIHGNALIQNVLSNYQISSNRCYVELELQNADTTITPDSPQFILSRHLFDGQTKEMLASSSIKKSRKTGMVYDNQYKANYLGFDATNEYINNKMASER